MEKYRYAVINATYLGLNTLGVTVLPITIHQEHGNSVHCFIYTKTNDTPIITTIDKEDICDTIQDAIKRLNEKLFPPITKSDELDKLSN